MSCIYCMYGTLSRNEGTYYVMYYCMCMTVCKNKISYDDMNLLYVHDYMQE